jgi:hypothetical protein
MQDSKLPQYAKHTACIPVGDKEMRLKYCRDATMVFFISQFYSYSILKYNHATYSGLDKKYKGYEMLEQGHTHHICQKLKGWTSPGKKTQRKIAPNHGCHTLL